MNLRSLFLPLLALALIGANAGARAAQFCVTSGTAFAAALATAATNGADDEIRLVAGTLTGSTQPNTNVRWPYTPGASDEATRLEISGGWLAAGGCATQVPIALETVLDAEFKGPGLMFVPQASNFAGQITLRNLTITRALATNNGGAAVLALLQGAGSSFRMERVVVVASQAHNSAGSIVAITQSGGGQARLINSVVAQNAVHHPSGSAVAVACFAPAVCYVSNNSIFENHVQQNGGHFGLVLGGVITASNNVVAHNTVGSSLVPGAQQAGGSTSQGGITLRNNHFETSQFGAIFSETGTSSGDPRWTRVGTYAYPDPDSPLRNTGLNSPLGGSVTHDVDGEARVQEGFMDRGAIESAALPVLDPRIFSSGFE